jgi:hypothetical protein
MITEPRLSKAKPMKSEMIQVSRRRKAESTLPFKIPLKKE